MEWTRPLPRSRYRFGWSWRRRQATASAIVPTVEGSLAGLAELDPVEDMVLFDLHGSDTRQVQQKVEILRQFVVAPALGPGPWGLQYVRKVLTGILGAAPGSVNSNRKPWLAAYLFTWLQSRLRYVNDPVDQELFTQFPDLLARGYGDCDDLTAAVAVLFAAAGIPVRARVIKTPNAEGWSHIYAVAYLNGEWRGFDASALPDGRPARPGWEYPHALAVMDLEILP